MLKWYHILSNAYICEGNKNLLYYGKCIDGNNKAF